MPLYQYHCNKCNIEIEKLQNFSDTTIIECPECKGTLPRILSPATLNFKGTGWYETDYKGK